MCSSLGEILGSSSHKVKVAPDLLRKPATLCPWATTYVNPAGCWEPDVKQTALRDAGWHGPAA